MWSAFQRKQASRALDDALRHEKRVARLEFFVSFIFLVCAVFLVFTEDIRSFFLERGAWPAFLDKLLLPDEKGGDGSVGGDVNGTLPPDSGGGDTSLEDQGLTVKESLKFLLGGLASILALGAISAFMYRTFGVARVIKKEAPDWDGLRDDAAITNISDKRRYDNVLFTIGSFAPMEMTKDLDSTFSRTFDKEAREFVASVRTALMLGYAPPEGIDHWDVSSESILDHFLSEFRRKHPDIPIPPVVHERIRDVLRMNDSLRKLTLESTGDDIEREFNLSKLRGDGRKWIEQMLLDTLVKMPWRREKGWSLDDLQRRASDWGISNATISGSDGMPGLRKMVESNARAVIGSAVHGDEVNKKTGLHARFVLMLRSVESTEEEIRRLEGLIKKLDGKKERTQGDKNRLAEYLSEKEKLQEGLPRLLKNVARLRKLLQEREAKVREDEKEVEKILVDTMKDLEFKADPGGTSPEDMEAALELDKGNSKLRKAWARIEKQLKQAAQRSEESLERARARFFAGLSDEDRKKEKEREEELEKLPIAPSR